MYLFGILYVRCSLYHKREDTEQLGSVYSEQVAAYFESRAGGWFARINPQLLK